MPYEILATSKSPALIIYLLDFSGSMSEQLGSKRRIDVVMEALGAMLRQRKLGRLEKFKPYAIPEAEALSRLLEPLQRRAA